MKIHLRAFASCLLVCVLSGCSLAFVSGPPADPNNREDTEPMVAPGECTESALFPIGDVAVAAAGLGAAIFGVPSEDLEEQEDNIRVVAGGLAALFGWSAKTGFGRTGDCRAAVARYRLRAHLEAEAEKVRAVAEVAKTGRPEESHRP